MAKKPKEKSSSPEPSPPRKRSTKERRPKSKSPPRRQVSRSRSRSPKRSERRHNTDSRRMSPAREKPPSRHRHKRDRHDQRRLTRQFLYHGSIPERVGFSEREKRREAPDLNQSFSRSPPRSRRSSPPPRAYKYGRISLLRRYIVGCRVKLARNKGFHDWKERTIDPIPESKSPPTKSPSPRYRNRMSSSPEYRERNPSPSSLAPSRDQRDDLSSPTPTPKSPDPRTPSPILSPRARHDKRDRRRLVASRVFGSQVTGTGEIRGSVCPIPLLDHSMNPMQGIHQEDLQCTVVMPFGQREMPGEIGLR